MLKEKIQLKILEKLMKRRMWGGKHTEERNLFKGLEKHIIGSRESKEALKELIQNGFLIKQKKTHEDHYSLNPDKMDEIYAHLEKLHKSTTSY